MSKATLPQPTKSELEILSVLWELGPSTVREVYDVLKERRETGYTTVLKFLQIMNDKGLVTRDTTSRSHVYKIVHAKERMQKALIKDFAEKAFGGSVHELIRQALGGNRASKKDITAVRKILDELEKK